MNHLCGLVSKAPDWQIGRFKISRFKSLDLQILHSLTIKLAIAGQTNLDKNFKYIDLYPIYTNNESCIYTTYILYVYTLFIYIKYMYMYI